MISSRYVCIPVMILGAILIALQINAGIVKDLATGIATTAPKAVVLVISNPVNSTVPIVAEVFKKLGVFDPKRYALYLLKIFERNLHSSVAFSVLPLSTSSVPRPSLLRSSAISPCPRMLSCPLSVVTAVLPYAAISLSSILHAKYLLS